ncbi:MAG: hypothetical protein ACLFNU_10325 [Bacteroidales bacterium]
MKKQNLLKLATMMIAMFFMTSAMAQGDPADYDLISNDGDVSYVTLDATIPLYVTPDNTFHPSWTPISNDLTADFVWNFSDDGSWTDGTEISLAVTDNYVEITGNTAGSYPINVKEQAPAAFGGCEDPTGQDFTVTVIEKPEAGIVGDGTNNTWTEPTAGYEYYMCGDALAEDLTVTITETGVPAALASYAYEVEKRVVNIDVSDVEDGATEVFSSVADHTIATKLATGTADGGSETVSTGDMPVVDGKRTKYEFTLRSATDYTGSGADGIISGISHKSDYLTVEGGGEITTYPFTGTTTVTYIVNPAPTTGPVYHIPNDFNL